MMQILIIDTKTGKSTSFTIPKPTGGMEEIRKLIHEKGKKKNQGNRTPCPE